MITYWIELATQAQLDHAEIEALKNNTQGLAYCDDSNDEHTMDEIRAKIGDSSIHSAMFETYTGDYTNIFVRYQKHTSWHKVYEFTVDDKPTKVIFRKGKQGNDIFALMPYEQADFSGHCACYTFSGHCAADYTGSIRASVPATFSEYRQLWRTMLSIGYNVKVSKRK